MSMHAEKKRKGIRAMFSLRRPAHRISGDTVRADCLREIQENIAITSPKVYESGIITRLDLRLVDLYGDNAIERNDVISTPAEHELAC